jgi:hypothetical protein
MLKFIGGFIAGVATTFAASTVVVGHDAKRHSRTCNSDCIGCAGHRPRTTV